MSCKSMPPVGDRGQRYEVRYYDGEGNEKVFGWAEDPKALVNSINAHPRWILARVVDRRKDDP